MGNMAILEFRGVISQGVARADDWGCPRSDAHLSAWLIMATPEESITTINGAIAMTAIGGRCLKLVPAAARGVLRGPMPATIHASIAQKAAIAGRSQLNVMIAGRAQQQQALAILTVENVLQGDMLPPLLQPVPLAQLEPPRWHSQTTAMSVRMGRFRRKAVQSARIAHLDGMRMTTPRSA